MKFSHARGEQSVKLEYGLTDAPPITIDWRKLKPVFQPERATVRATNHDLSDPQSGYLDIVVRGRVYKKDGTLGLREEWENYTVRGQYARGAHPDWLEPIIADAIKRITSRTTALPAAPTL